MEENYWKKYCSFFDMDFASQVAENRKWMDEYFEDWKKTKMAKHLCPDGVKSFDDVPVTTYSDYPILQEFGVKMKTLEKNIPRKKDEGNFEYYDRLSRQIIDMLDGWMADTYSFCVKTSGTTSESKWIIQGETLWKNLVRSVMAAEVICCSEKTGTTSYKSGFTLFGVGAPIPFIGGYVMRALNSQGITVIPSEKIMSQESNFMKKVQLAIRYAKKAGKIDSIGSTGSIFRMLALYFTNKAKLYREVYRNTRPGLKKVIIGLLMKYEEAFGKKVATLKEIISPKGIFMGSYDTELYLDFVREQLSLVPVNVFGATELGFVFYGRPENKFSFFPDLQSGYFEFIDQDDKIRKINELEKGKSYEFIHTPFRSILFRYRIGDIFKVIDIKSDGLPELAFESRKTEILDIHNYFRLSTSLAVRACKRAGFPPSCNWTFTKEYVPNDHLLLLMENDLNLTEKQVSERIFASLKDEDQFFRNYITDFGIQNPEDVIKVEFVKRGAFGRYMEKKIKEGVAMSRIKPFRIVTEENKDIVALLRE